MVRLSHTPGLYQAHETPDGIMTVVRADDGSPVADILTDSEADMHLLAAAWDLHSSCHDLIRAIHNALEDGTMKHATPEIVNVMCAAVISMNKAKGGK